MKIQVKIRKEELPYLHYLRYGMARAKPLYILLSLVVCITTLHAQTDLTVQLAKHEEVISDFEPNTRALLKKFTQVVTNYSDTAFIKLFAFDFIDYCKTSELYRNDVLEDAVWINLTVALEDQEEYFDRSIPLSMPKGTYNQVKNLFFIGKEEFGGNGFKVFYKLILQNGKIIGGRIFLHPSGPNGRLEIHGSYG